MNKFTKMTGKEFEAYLVEKVAEAYNTVEGAGAFESRTAKEQHDIIMALVAGLLR